ncbi:hypothetical protein CTAYLR_003269 [Chrysophaeum taylorii]|uniref:Hexose transporter 1 n=1 Tax=Chrysophaeum taylorii TaxID=2483200 RepID=A0AAD7UAF9_9STRA|nr:hypothetical protein CTAYLR_003269 [Chrysophaeum taylorii]
MFGYTVSFTGSTLTAMIRGTGACPGDDVCQVGALIASISALAAAVSALVSGWLTDRIGRRQVLVWNNFLWICGYATLAVARDAAWVLAARAACGFAMGTTSVVVPVYVSETAPPELRGKLGGLFNVAISSGILLAFALGLVGVDGWWRVMAALGTLPPCTCFVIAMTSSLMPETPRWLVSKGCVKDARLAASKLGPGCEKSLVDDALASDKVASTTGDDVATTQRALFLGVGAVTCFATSGNNALQAYMDVILAHGGVNDYALGGALFAATQLVFAVAMFMVIIDRCGRRPLLLASSSGASLSLFAMARASELESGAWTVAFACSFIASVTLGLSTLSLVYASEVFPDKLRGRAMSASTFVFWAGSFALVEAFVPVARLITIPRVCDILGLSCALGACFFFAFAIETKGTSLSEIQRNLADSRLAFFPAAASSRDRDGDDDGVFPAAPPKAAAGAPSLSSTSAWGATEYTSLLPPASSSTTNDY